MSKVKPRVLPVKAHRAVDWNEKAIRKVIAERGYVLAGIKVDGMRCHVLKIDGEVVFLTRAGIEISALSPYKSQFADAWQKNWALTDELVLDCEVWIPSMNFEEGGGMLRRDDPIALGLVQFVVLDIISKGQLCAEPQDLTAAYVARHTGIVGRFSSVFGERNLDLMVSEALAKVTDIADLPRIYGVSRQMGFEGLVVKDPSLAPRNGKVSGMWKVKPGCGAEFAPGWEGDGKIVGYVWGDDAKANAGKIVGFRVALEDGTEVNATGLTQALMDKMTHVFKSNFTKDAYMGRYVEVTAMEKTAGGSLRHPSFRRFRDLDSAQGAKC
jgi:ATP-dependent DNA ligase